MKKKWYDYLPTIDDIIVLNIFIALLLSPIVLLVVFVKYFINLFK
jgi:hypothetical protein